MGLDIGQHMVRWAAVEPQSGKVKELWSAELKPGRGQKQDVLEGDALEKRLREVLATCQKQVSNWSKAVHSSVQGVGSICGYLELPKLTDKELKNAVPSKLMRQLPFPIDDVILTHVVVPPLDGDSATKSAVIYVAVQKKVVEQRTHMFKALGLEARNLEVPALALARVYARNHAPPPDSLNALVQIGYQFTQVVVVRQGLPYYHRQFPSGGADATYAFQMGAQSDWKTAEDYKLDYDCTRRQVSIEPFLTKWLGEVKRTLDSFRGRQGNIAVADVTLQGAGGRWPGLAERLQEAIKLPVQVDAWDRLVVDAAAQRAGDASSFSLAVGLALATV